jgi:hypothetical protein
MGADPGRAPASRKVTVNVIPKVVDIFLDGKPVGSWVPGAPIAMPAGTHAVEFRNPSCYPSDKITVGPADHDLGVIRLAWKPAYLTVKTTPDDAEVMITPAHGKATVMSGRNPVTIPIPASSADGHESVRIFARADGYAAREISVDILAGSRKPVDVELTRR